MIEVEIQNFQSIEKTSFRIDGFTVLIGRSNIGKSAAVRAVKCALTGAAGTDFVRHGPTCERRVKGNKKCKCKTTVTIKTAAVQLTWEKGDEVNQYTVMKDGKETVLTAVNRGTPDFLLPDFEPVKVGDRTDLLQVSEQFESPFLLKESGAAVADVLADVAKLDDINLATRLVAKDRKNAVATRNVRDKDIETLTAELEGYEGLDKAVERAVEVEAQHDRVQKVGKAVEHLEVFIKEHETLDVAIKALKKAVAPKLPDAEKLMATGTAFAQLSRFYDELVARGPLIRRLKGIDAVTLPELSGVTSVMAVTTRLDDWLDHLRTLKTELGRFKQVKDLAEPDASGLQAASEHLQKVQGWLSRYEVLKAAEAELGARLTAVEEEEKELLEQFEALGVCPTCSLPLHPEHRKGAA